MTAWVGLDVGGTYLKGALVSEAGEVRGRLHERIVRDDPGRLLDQLAAAVATLEADGGPSAGAGIGLPGIVERLTARLHAAPNLSLLDGMRVGEEVGRRCGRMAVIENDANAAALAEAWRGGGRGARSVLFVTLGTGIGGGLVFDGRVWGGVSGYAGEIGHIQVDPCGEPCGCGSRGCLETVAGIAGWVRRAYALLETGAASPLRGRELDPAVIVEAAVAGDPLAREVVDGAAAALGVGIAAALQLLNLDRVVIGGGVAQAGSFLLERIVEQTRRRSFPHVFADCAFAPATLGNDAGVIGAARVAMLANAGGHGPKPA
jgi:glucokinase